MWIVNLSSSFGFMIHDSAKLKVPPPADGGAYEGGDVYFAQLWAFEILACSLMSY